MRPGIHTLVLSPPSELVHVTCYGQWDISKHDEEAW